FLQYLEAGNARQHESEQGEARRRSPWRADKRRLGVEDLLDDRTEMGELAGIRFGGGGLAGTTAGFRVAEEQLGKRSGMVFGGDCGEILVQGRFRAGAPVGLEAHTNTIESVARLQWKAIKGTKRVSAHGRATTIQPPAPSPAETTNEPSGI